MAFYRLEPFGVTRDDLRVGNIAAMMYNYSRTKKSQERLTAADFLLFSDVPKDKRKQRRAAVDRFNAAVAQSRVNRRARLAREEAERTAQQEHSSG